MNTQHLKKLCLKCYWTSVSHGLFRL